MRQINIKKYFNQEMDKLRQSPLRPSLMIIDATDGDIGNQIYIKKKVDDFNDLGWPVQVIKVNNDEELEHALHSKSDCIIVQMSVAKKFHFSPMQVIRNKDCDGLHPGSFVIPATVRGIIDYLDVCEFPYSGKTAVVLGRSDIVGKPMARALLNKDMTVIQCHSKTPPFVKCNMVEKADLVVVATGKSYSLERASCPHAIVIDVGISRLNGKIVGDFKEKKDHCDKDAWSTPVPGGVGLLTRLGLLKNCLDLKKKQNVIFQDFDK